ncbi:methyltransferase [Fibrisoma limi BUZ 3]|uniref:Methyltransferase n=1 Tax=Fibrisoma limi BUZ 3 TaxID=1185876 RepID=I2GC03_9BACT|nr:L-histidine N(alpha)-methyltransferase [Fibrisoma limi]CCH51427.1 methyltransferase [Fibrisoma limi BUZ 3]
MAVHGNTNGDGVRAGGVERRAEGKGLGVDSLSLSPSPQALSPSPLAEEVRTGLAKTPKRLSSRFFYDAEGSRIFQEIMHAPEYYLTRSEYEILDTHKSDLARLFAAGGYEVDLIELGAGDGLKTKLLLEHLWENQVAFRYVPVDISEDALEGLVGTLRQQWPSMTVRPQHSDYFTALERLSGETRPHRAPTRRVVLFLGSNIGNFTTSETIHFYRSISSRLLPGDLVLTGVDLQKHPAVIHAAYNDRQGLTRAFNLNLLRRINRELDANFDLSAFDHYETYDPESGEARSYLVSQKAQQVQIRALSITVPFAYGEVIHTEISRKFTRTQLEQLANETGFSLTNWFTDCKEYFADVIFQKQ